MKKFFSDLINSLNTDKGGFSLRKILAFFAVISAAILSDRHSTAENLIYLVGIWLTFALLCLGLVTAAQLISIKTGSTSTTSSSSSETKTETK